MSPTDDVYMISEENTLDPMETLKRLRARQASAPTRVGANRVAFSQEQNVGSHPLLASTLSMFLCGAGQICNRQFKLGLLLLLVEGLAIVSHWSAIQIWPSIRESLAYFGIDQMTLVLSAAAADLMLIFLLLFGIHQAYRRGESYPGEYEGAHNPIAPGLASLLVPGWGQLVNAQAGKALVFFFSLLGAAWVIGFARLTPISEALLPGTTVAYRTQQETFAILGALGVLAIMWVISVYDAVLVGLYRRRSA